MRKTAVILICCLCVGALVNRDAFKDDISNRTVVQGVGIDYNDDGTYTVTMETINTDNYSNDDGSASPVANVRSFKGNTVNSAIKSAYATTGKTPVMSQNRVIIIGNKLAEKGIMFALDFFIRDAENYPSVLVAAVETSAEDFFKKATGESVVVSRDVENIILTADDDLTVSSITLCELVNRYESAGTSFYMPLMSTVKEGEKNEVAAKGTLIFNGGKSVGALSKDETASLNFLCNNVKKGALDFFFEGNPSALSIIKSHSVRKIESFSDTAYFSVKISIEADLAETGNEQISGLTQQDINSMCSLAEDKVKNDIDAICNKLYKEMNTDAAGLSRLIYIRYPDIFRQNEKNLSEIMTESHYSVEVDVRIRRIGQDYSS